MTTLDFVICEEYLLKEVRGFCFDPGRLFMLRDEFPKIIRLKGPFNRFLNGQKENTCTCPERKVIKHEIGILSLSFEDLYPMDLFDVYQFFDDCSDHLEKTGWNFFYMGNNCFISFVWFKILSGWEINFWDFSRDITIIHCNEFIGSQIFSLKKT